MLSRINAIEGMKKSGWGESRRGRYFRWSWKGRSLNSWHFSKNWGSKSSRGLGRPFPEAGKTNAKALRQAWLGEVKEHRSAWLQGVEGERRGKLRFYFTVIGSSWRVWAGDTRSRIFCSFLGKEADLEDFSDFTKVAGEWHQDLSR